MKKINQVAEILESIIPNIYSDIKTEYNWTHFKISAICEVEKEVATEYKKQPKRKDWFLFWNENDKWHISLDGTRGYDYLSYESEFGQCKDMLNKLCNLLGTVLVKGGWFPQGETDEQRIPFDLRAFVSL